MCKRILIEEYEFVKVNQNHADVSFMNKILTSIHLNRFNLYAL